MAKPKPTDAAHAQTLLRDQAIDAMITIVAAKGWNGATLSAIAEEAGITLPALQGLFAGKEALYAAFVERIDHAMLAGVDPVSAGDTTKDRLFDIIMNRFEALRSAKPMLARFWQDGLRLDFPLDPLNVMAGRQSLAWILEAAGLSSTGLRGQMRILGLAGVMLTALRAFLDDSSEDLSPTMAKLDETLQRTDEMARTFRL